jgi:ribosome-associated translation inhibitor RaiA
MILNCAANEGFEISPRFRQSIESRIEKLERDADADEIYALRLVDVEHIRRQLRLVAAQRAEAVRMRLFLARTRTRLPPPMIEL